MLSRQVSRDFICYLWTMVRVPKKYGWREAVGEGGGGVNDAGAPGQGPKLFSLLKPRQEGPFLVLCSSETML